MTTTPTPRPTRLQRRTVLSVGAVALTAVLLAVAIWSADSRPGSSTGVLIGPTPNGATPSPSAVPSDGSSVDDAEAPWVELELPPVGAGAATLVPTRTDRDRVAVDTAFNLTSLGRWTAAELAPGVVVEPSIELNVTSEVGDGTAATIRPANALDPGRLYRFTVRTPDGAIGGSWAFLAAAPLHVVTTVPGDQATNVPATTGIELTFDQDGDLDISSHFSIRPAVQGAFEQHGRTVVFVPDGLKPATVYTVIVTRGVRLEGSDQVLETDVRLQFETAPGRKSSGDSSEHPPVWFGFARPMLEVRPGDRPTLAVSISASPTSLARNPFAVTIHRLPSENAGTEAVRQLAAAPSWARWSGAGLVSTTGLTRVAAFSAQPAQLSEGGDWSFELPATLDAGWYLVEIPRPDRPAQTVLQATDIAAYSAIASDRFFVWANDVASGEPLVGATVEVVGGDVLGQTDADGLLLADTPLAIRRAAAHADPLEAPLYLAVRSADGRSYVVPIGVTSGGSGYLSDISGSGSEEPSASDYWRFLSTDRWTYRSTDRINVWGFVRPRDGVASPNPLRLALTNDFPITTVSVTPDATGSFTASFAISELPFGGYSIELTGGDLHLGSVWVSVTEIVKPAYSIEVTTDRHVVVSGEPVTVTARATFFDGTSLPGTKLSIDTFGTRQTVTTDRTGTATITAAPKDSGGISVHPARSEEAEINTWASVWVFPSSVMIKAQATIDAGQIDLNGSIHDVAIQQLESAQASERWSSDPAGPGVRGARIKVQIIERRPVRIRTNHVYDFISKQVVDTYGYRWDEVTRTTRTLTSDADGAFQLALPGRPDHEYEISLSAPDAEGRLATAFAWAQGPDRPDTANSLVPYLEPGDCVDPDSSGYGVGDEICVLMRNGAGQLPTGDGNRYLFFAAHRGFREVVVQDTPRYSSTFLAEFVPNLNIWGVRFSGTTFTPVEQPSVARFDTEQRRLEVAITADRGRYAPGETVTLEVWTRDQDGGPVSAGVVVRAVDEKLYASGGASDQDPLWDLFRETVEASVLWTHASHPVPFARDNDCGAGGGCGDTSGGDGDARSEFADALLFRKVTTNANGHARLSFKLSDDLTSWHVTATATTAVPQAGMGSVLVPVSLPFFVDATLAPEYLVGERPILRLRSFGSDLAASDRVTYTVSSKSLGLSATTVRGSAFGDVDIPLPALAIGDQTVTVSASVRHRTRLLSDRLTRRFAVVASRFSSTRTTFETLASELRPEGGHGWTTYVVSDAGRGRYLSLLQSLSWTTGARVDQVLAGSIARGVLVDAFDVDPESLRKDTFDPHRYQQYNGIALLPYSSPDLALTARIAILAPDQFNRDELAAALRDVPNRTDSTRERRILAVAGLAGLGTPVLADLRAFAADPDLTIRERLYLALGFAALGDDAATLAIERDLLSQYGERRGASIRIRVGRSVNDTIEATALMALVAAQLGEPFAPELETYVDANPAVDELYNLHQVAFVTRVLERTPSTAARFAYSLDGKRTVVDLGPGDTFSLTLTEPQRATLILEPLDGSLGLATTWQTPLDLGTITPDPDLSLTRTILPSGVLSSAALVEVRLTAIFGPQAATAAGCHTVTDMVPSGLAPIANVQGWYESSATTVKFVEPYEVEAQRVSFCVWPSAVGRRVSMRYFARVVTPGEYVWEPSVIQSTVAAESLNVTAEGHVTLR